MLQHDGKWDLVTMDAFRAKFTGEILTPDSARYDQFRSVWNGAIDRKPAVIACCTTAAQVADALQFARRAGLEVAVRHLAMEKLGR